MCTTLHISVGLNLEQLELERLTQKYLKKEYLYKTNNTMSVILRHLLNLALTGVDIVSDIMLVIVDAEWCALTWAFIAGPFLTFIIIILTFCLSGLFESAAQALTYWKATEVCLEAGPQLVLQLYIIALSEQNPTSETGKI